MAVRTVGAADLQTDGTWKVGLARVKITPQRPVALLGYGDRTGPFESVAADIYAKAMAVEDQQGWRAVLVTADLVGFQAAVVTDEVCRRIGEKTGLERRQLLFNASHCHTGPLVSLDPHPQANSVAHPPLSADDVRETVAYTQQLRNRLVDVVCDALADLQPAQLAWGTGQIGFPMNRRLPQDARVVMADNPAGPADRSVPVLRVQAADGRLLAVLFGCACHNTTLTGRDNVIAGDYAGFAQEMIEREHGTAMALFMSGCGADANPSPRGSMELARQHGEALAQEVGRVLAGELAPVTGDLVTALRYMELPLQQLSREEITARTNLPSAEAVMARQMLAVLDRGERLPTSYRAPLAVWQFGRDLTLVGLPAEPVAEYVSLLQQTLGTDQLWVAGFNNDCFGYLPTARVVREGGHEAIGVTLWVWSQGLQQQAGFFTAEVEEIVLRETRRLAREAGRPVLDTLLPATGVPDWVVFPQRAWARCSAVEAGFNPEFPGYGEYVDPPYTIQGQVVRGGPGWIAMSAEDLARFGLLVATGGVWNGQRLVSSQWLRGHAGLDIHVVAGDRESFVSIAKINTKGFPFGAEVGTQGAFRFPSELILDSPAVGAHAPQSAVTTGTTAPVAATPGPPFPIRVAKTVRIPMRDGVTLAADIWRPDTDGQFPALLQVSYYVTRPGIAEPLTPRGYVCILANSRGRGGSEGEWDPYVNEPRDVFDAQTWVAQQPWCNGRVGMFGQSYNAFTQIMSAPLANLHFLCMVPVEGQQSFFGHQFSMMPHIRRISFCP